MRLMATFFLFLLINTQIVAAPLLIGTLPFSPPFEIPINNKSGFTGFDIDLMSEICRRLQTQCRFVPLKLNDIFSGVTSGKIDLGIATIDITNERQLLYLFSIPYLLSMGQIMVNKGSNLDSTPHLTGKNLGIENRSLFQRIAKTKFSGSNIMTFDNQQTLVQALADHRVDAVLLDAASAQYWIEHNDVLYKFFGPPIQFGNGYGIMANLSNGALIDRINKALLDMEADGTFLKLYKRYWGLTPDLKIKPVFNLKPTTDQ